MCKPLHISVRLAHITHLTHSSTEACTFLQCTRACGICRRVGVLQAGDQVKAIGGMHSGQPGLILTMDSDTGICIVLADSTREEIKVLSRHLTRSTETTATLDT